MYVSISFGFILTRYANKKLLNHFKFIFFTTHVNTAYDQYFLSITPTLTISHTHNELFSINLLLWLHRRLYQLVNVVKHPLRLLLHK